MKKNLIAIIILISIFTMISYFVFKQDDSYTILKVISATEFYVDFNENKICDEDELISLYELKSFNNKLSDSDNARLNYLSDLYAKNVLWGNKIKIKINKSNRKQFILSDGSDYVMNLEKYGYVFSDGNSNIVTKNLNYARKLNLVSFNSHSNKIHKLDCKFALASSRSKVVRFETVPHKTKLCKFCYLKNHTKNKITRENKYPRDVQEKYSPVYKDDFLEFYITDFTKHFYPSNKCLTTPCKSLLKQINNAKTSIDFAIYGIDGQPEIVKALLAARNRGVNVRWVYDSDKNGNTIYKESLALKKALSHVRSDIELLTNSNESIKYKDAIMHNKFFVFDSNKVWTGSANISHTDLSGFNANSIVLITSKEIAKIYETEFEQMYSGKFHKLKSKTNSNYTRLGTSEIEVLFSPQDSIISNRLIPLINSAKKYVYVPVFVITHKSFNQALIDAKKRGVDVKIIVDATAAGGKYSSVKTLRENGLAVKVENRAGKMHMKSMIIDDNYVVIGSMNFSKSGESYNDENILIIKNPSLAKAFKQKFNAFWVTIPDKWLLKNPGAESWNSVNSCFDGVDNDFDNKIDMQDEGCNYNLKK